MKNKVILGKLLLLIVLFLISCEKNGIDQTTLSKNSAISLSADKFASSSPKQKKGYKMVADFADCMWG